MSEKLDEAIDLADTDIRPAFENIWENVVGEDISDEYRILIWGSTVEDRREPVDLDLIFEYHLSDSIAPEKEKSIESWVKSNTHTDEFSYVDPLVVHYPELPSIISNSRVSRIYSVDEDGWLDFGD